MENQVVSVTTVSRAMNMWTLVNGGLPPEDVMKVFVQVLPDDRGLKEMGAYTAKKFLEMNNYEGEFVTFYMAACWNIRLEETVMYAMRYEHYMGHHRGMVRFKMPTEKFIRSIGGTLTYIGDSCGFIPCVYVQLEE